MFQLDQLSPQDLSGPDGDEKRVDRLFDISFGSNWRLGDLTFRNFLSHERICPRWQMTTRSHFAWVLLFVDRDVEVDDA
jgi:hypothetical protein